MRILVPILSASLLSLPAVAAECDMDHLRRSTEVLLEYHERDVFTGRDADAFALKNVDTFRTLYSEASSCSCLSAMRPLVDLGNMAINARNRPYSGEGRELRVRLGNNMALLKASVKQCAFIQSHPSDQTP